MVVREVGVEVVRPLRHLVLRPGRPEDTTHISRDSDPHTWHLAAFAGEQVVGVMTLFTDETAFASGRPAERFRWMAVHPDWQGHGVGRGLLHEAAGRLDARDVTVIWAHGRDSAQGFYERYGFRVEGDGFIDPDTDISHHIVVADVRTVRDLTRYAS